MTGLINNASVFVLGSYPSLNEMDIHAGGQEEAMVAFGHEGRRSDPLHSRPATPPGSPLLAVSPLVNYDA